MTDEFISEVQKLVARRMVRNCPDANCPYIKAAIVEMMVPYIIPLAQVVGEKASGYVNTGDESVHTFVTDIIYEVMAVMGQFAGTSVRVTLDVCNACMQAASVEKGERH